MIAYDPAEWHDFFVANAGATAALAGLVFVAVSINIERILAYKGLPERALETIMLLMLVLVVSVVGLIPGQSTFALGIELLFVAAVAAVTIYRLPTYESGEGRPRSWVVTRWALRLFPTVPFLIGGISVLAETGGGLYWIVAGVVFAIIGAVANAWVLLVEILR